MIEIIPAIMPFDAKDLESHVSRVKRSVSWVQIDVMDGQFVKAKTWPYKTNRESFDSILNEAEGLPFWEDVEYEIDLMVTKPEEVIEEWISAGAGRIIVHIESTQQLSEIIRKVNERLGYTKENGKRDVELWLALNIETPTEKITEYLEDIDGVQFMGIDTIGLQGQEFDDAVVQKIREFHNAHPEIPLAVDGGVSLETAPLLVEAGVTHLVCGSAIFNSDNVAHTIEALKALG